MYRTLLAVAAALVALLPARANDGALSLGGSPSLLSGHKTVSMQREVIRMTVGEDSVSVDCRFTFKNDGPACTVRMGFPDEGRGADGEEDDETAKKGPVRGRFTAFRSYVNGMEVKTTLARSKDPNRVWHAKEVRMPANGTVEVRDVYTLPVGSQISGHNSVFRQASYILSSGASWKGNIGSSEVLVTFDRKRPAAPLEPRVIKSGGEEKTLHLTDWSRQASHVVYWNGFAIPTVVNGGKTLRFFRENWRPTPRSDVYLAFDDETHPKP